MGLAAIRSREASVADMQVLLVEDNPGDVELVLEASMDGDMPYGIEVVSDGVEALAYLRREGASRRPDLILLDLKMPRMDGLQLLAELSRDAELQRIPAVVLTSSEAPRDLARAYELGATACFGKPGTGLEEVLRDILRFVRRSLPRPPASASPVERVSPGFYRPALEATRQTQELAAIVESAADAIIGTSLDGTITSWNASAESLYGHRASEVVGHGIDLIIPEERRGELGEIVDAVAQGRATQAIRTVRVTRDGEERHIGLTISPVRDSTGTIIGKSAIARDITAEVQAEERFRLAVEAAPSAMLMIDDTGQIVLCNAEAERLFGYARDELLGLTVDDLVPAELRGSHPAHREAFMAAPQVRSMGAGRELYGLCKDGRQVPIEIGLNPITTNEGTFVL
ncbi:MAG: PAS domain S-box protein, partial [Myxococcales bacterium]|nr:PAS domain S-box protein [Myxococcales bacterium]